MRTKVEAEGMNPPKSEVRMYFDGAEQRHSYYSRATGNLSYRPTGMLSPGTHTVEIVASAEQGRSTARKSWTFTISSQGREKKRGLTRRFEALWKASGRFSSRWRRVRVDSE
jgi:hypothetical protein